MTEELKTEIQGRISESNGMARLCNIGNSILTAVAVLASGCAAVCGALGLLEGSPLAILAAVPGVAVGLQRSHWLEARTAWHTERALRLAALVRALRDEGRALAEISKELSKTELEMERRWIEMRQPHIPQK